MEIQDIQELIAKYLSGEATAEEKERVEKWYDSIRGDEINLEAHQLNHLKNEAYAYLFDATSPNDTSRIILREEHGRTRPLLVYLQWGTAVAAALLIVTGVMLWTTAPEFKVSNALTAGPVQKVKNDIAPGGNKAVLMLADGSRIVLNDAKNGELTQQGNIVVNKEKDGLLTYRVKPGNTKEQQKETALNSIATPRGGQYQVVLPDGTKVWLNAASTLKFPTAFTGNERNVGLTGEAYFEVAKNPGKPFRVTSAGQTIEVLGTHFDVNAYDDEPVIKTTLLEGSIKLNSGSKNAVLKPGQQATLSLSGLTPIRVKNDIDVDAVMAWKNQLFEFNHDNIQTIMRQVSRWYDVDIAYEGNIPEDRFEGKISRNVDVSQILKILELSGVNFRIEGKKIIVKK